MAAEARMRRTRPEAKGRLGPPEAGRGRGVSSPRCWRDHGSVDSLTSGFWPPGHEIIHFCGFKTPIMWGSVTTAAGPDPSGVAAVLVTGVVSHRYCYSGNNTRYLHDVTQSSNLSVTQTFPSLNSKPATKTGLTN